MGAECRDQNCRKAMKSHYHYSINESSEEEGDRNEKALINIVPPPSAPLQTSYIGTRSSLSDTIKRKPKKCSFCPTY